MMRRSCSSNDRNRQGVTSKQARTRSPRGTGTQKLPLQKRRRIPPDLPSDASSVCCLGPFPLPFPLLPVLIVAAGDDLTGRLLLGLLLLLLATGDESLTLAGDSPSPVALPAAASKASLCCWGLRPRFRELLIGRPSFFVAVMAIEGGWAESMSYFFLFFIFYFSRACQVDG